MACTMYLEYTISAKNKRIKLYNDIRHFNKSLKCLFYNYYSKGYSVKKAQWTQWNDTTT